MSLNDGDREVFWWQAGVCALLLLCVLVAVLW